MKKFFVFASFVSVYIFGSGFVLLETNLPPCDQDIAVSDIVIAQDNTIQVSGLIISAQTIVQNSNLIYRSGSGSVLSYGMTGSLSGVSEGFQIYEGSTLSIEIADCDQTL